MSPLCVFFVGIVCSAAAADLDPQTIVATVGDDSIRAGEVTRVFALATRGQQVDPAARPVLQAQSLAELVSRRLVLAYAQRTNELPSPAQVDAVLAELKRSESAQGRRWADYLQRQAATETDVRRQIAWNLVWAKYLARYATESRLQSYFRDHSRDFDGTQVAVSHILLRAEPGLQPAKDRLIAQAENIRRAITAGELSFADAARKYSAGPSAAQGGQLGLIPRHGVMDEAFSRAAFALEEREISPPVPTRFGVHLIRCDAVKPGMRQWSDARPALEDALGRELLDKLAQAQGPFTRVEFSGRMPYFELGMHKLIMPHP